MARQRLVRGRGSLVTWVAFALVIVLALIVGLVANRQVVGLVHDHLLHHGMSHNRHVAERTAAALHKLIDRALGEEEILRRFRYGSRVSDAFGYALMLVDAPTGRVFAHSDPSVAENRPRLEALLRSPARFPSPPRASPSTDVAWEGALRATDVTGMPVLVYFQPVDRRWTLGVASDLRYLNEFESMLTQRLNQLLMASVAMIALLGFLIVRGAGRGYERDLEQEVRERTSEVEAAQAELLKKTRLASIGQTAAMLVHELRNPLASMKLGLTDLIGADALDAPDRRRLSIVRDQVDRLDGLLSEVLDCVRPVRVTSDPVALDRLLDDAAELLGPLFAQRGVRLVRERCPNCPALLLDRALMAQAIINLLKNALEASPDDSDVAVRLAQWGDRLVLEITNLGPMIPVADRERIFEPFVSNKSLGTGLGLPMVKRVVDEHGGDISLRSDPDRGTCFTLSFPLPPDD